MTLWHGASFSAQPRGTQKPGLPDSIQGFHSISNSGRWWYPPALGWAAAAQGTWWSRWRVVWALETSSLPKFLREKISALSYHVFVPENRPAVHRSTLYHRYGHLGHSKIKYYVSHWTGSENAGNWRRRRRSPSKHLLLLYSPVGPRAAHPGSVTLRRSRGSCFTNALRLFSCPSLPQGPKPGTTAVS